MFQLFNYDVEAIIEYSRKDYEEPSKKKSYLEKVLECFEIKKNELIKDVEQYSRGRYSIFGFRNLPIRPENEDDVLEWYNDCKMIIENELSKIELIEQPEQLKKVKKDLPTRKQHKFWGDEKLFQSLLKQLSLVDNGFIDEESARNWKSTYDNHFKGDVFDCDKGNKINWIESPPAFKYFYDTFFKGYFVGAEGHTVFFEAHFFHHGNPKAASDVKIRNECPQDRKKKLDCIFKFLAQLRQNCIK